MTGAEYAKLIADYIISNFSNRGVKVYTEVSLGKTVIGKNRRIDIFVLNESTNDAYAIECKFQGTKGTVDEKIPYTIEDINKLPIDGCIAYAGEGFSTGVLHLLESYPFSAYCLPSVDKSRSIKTRELDHLLAMKFGWWDLVVGNKPQHVSNLGLFKK